MWMWAARRIITAGKQMKKVHSKKFDIFSISDEIIF